MDGWSTSGPQGGTAGGWSPGAGQASQGGWGQQPAQPTWGQQQPAPSWSAGQPPSSWSTGQPPSSWATGQPAGTDGGFFATAGSTTAPPPPQAGQAPTWPGGPQPGFAGGPPQGPRKQGLTGLQIGLLIAGVIVALGIVAAIAVVNVVGDVVEAVPAEALVGDLEQGDTYGDNPTLDALWDGCAAGTYEDCDTLFFISEIGSEYEYFGDSCGRRNEPAGLCAEIYR